ncbi:MAG: hypothetical protein ABWK01_03890 [Infirmifilum sp.]
MGFDGRKWALNWIRGSVVSYVYDKIPLNMLIGRIRKSMESYGVTVDDVKSLLESLLLDPTLSTISDDERRRRIKEVLKSLEGEPIGVKHGQR